MLIQKFSNEQDQLTLTTACNLTITAAVVL